MGIILKCFRAIFCFNQTKRSTETRGIRAISCITTYHKTLTQVSDNADFLISVVKLHGWLSSDRPGGGGEDIWRYPGFPQEAVHQLAHIMLKIFIFSCSGKNIILTSTGPVIKLTVPHLLVEVVGSFLPTPTSVFLICKPGAAGPLCRTVRRDSANPVVSMSNCIYSATLGKCKLFSLSFPHILSLVMNRLFQTEIYSWISAYGMILWE